MTNHINTVPVVSSVICSLLDQLLCVLQHFFKRDKIYHTQKTVQFMSLKTKHYDGGKYNNNNNNNDKLRYT